MPTACIFGSSTARPDDRCCLLAADLAAGLARLGFDIKNGGYTGVMEAASRAAREAGGRVIGITVRRLAGSRRANPFLTEERPADDLLGRLRLLTEGTDVFYAIEAGGPGTLNELFLVWAQVILGEHAGTPIVLVGPTWPGIIDRLTDGLAIAPEQVRRLTLAPDVPAALEVARAISR